MTLIYKTDCMYSRTTNELYQFMVRNIIEDQTLIWIETSVMNSKTLWRCINTKMSNKLKTNNKVQYEIQLKFNNKIQDE